MTNSKALLLMGILCISITALGQTGKITESNDYQSLTDNKGKFFFFWGYNRSSYSKSDIHLIGNGYDFTLSDVEAQDLPKKFSSVYVDPSQFTIPQFNFRIGFFINDKYAIAAGWDHMKYQTINGRKAIINGRIDSTASNIYAGNYNNQSIVMDEDLLVKMEHSDGFNIVNVNLERNDLLFHTINEKVALNLVSGAGIGIAMPWTNSIIFAERNDDRPHFSGLGAQVFIAPEAIFFKKIFVRFTVQGGFANMWDIATKPKGDNSAHAEQTIYYLERSLVMGYKFRVFK